MAADEAGHPVRGIRLRVQRLDPTLGKEPKFHEYTVPSREGMTILDALLHVKDYIDHSLAVRFSCRMATCGSCGMKIDGKPGLACETQVSELKGKVVTVQPMDNFPIIRDLVVDLERFFTHERDILPHLVRTDVGEQDHPTGEYLMKPEELEAILQFTYCIKCGLCSSSCPTAATDPLFLGPQALAQAYRYTADVRDEAGKARLDVSDRTHGVWRCHFAGTCSAVCPKGVDPALGIQLFKRHVISGRSPRKAGSKLNVNAHKELFER